MKVFITCCMPAVPIFTIYFLVENPGASKIEEARLTEDISRLLEQVSLVLSII